MRVMPMRNLTRWFATAAIILLCISIGSFALGQGVYIQRGDLDGLVCIEAENFAQKQAVEDHQWQFIDSTTGFAGSGAMTATPDDGSEEDDPDYGDSPFIDYQVYFVRTGRHYIWVRGWGVDDGNSCHVDLDHRELDNGKEIEFDEQRWNWAHKSDDYDFAYFDIDTPGLHTISLCMQEDGVLVDRIVLSADPDYRPQGAGPDPTTDGAVVSFVTPRVAASESSSQPAKIAVTNWGPRDAEVSVDYAVIGGTAGSEDYRLPTGTLRFRPQQEKALIPLEVFHDGIDEQDETVLVRLSNPQGDGTQLGSHTTLTYTIVDPRPTVEFAKSSSACVEEDQNG